MLYMQVLQAQESLCVEHVSGLSVGSKKNLDALEIMKSSDVVMLVMQPRGNNVWIPVYLQVSC